MLVTAGEVADAVGGADACWVDAWGVAVGAAPVDEADGIYGATIEERVEGALFQYYIIGENDKSASLSPKRAGKELYTVEAGS